MLSDSLIAKVSVMVSRHLNLTTNNRKLAERVCQRAVQSDFDIDKFADLCQVNDVVRCFPVISCCTRGLSGEVLAGGFYAG